MIAKFTGISIMLARFMIYDMQVRDNALLSGVKTPRQLEIV